MDGTAPAVFSGLTFLHTVDEESVWSAATWSGQSDEDAAWATGSPGIPPGHLIVDSAAGEALIGEAACVRWEQKLSDARLRGVRVHCKMMTPKGVGGAAHPKRSMMMPTMIDGLPGVLQYTVVEEDIPGLLPLSFQEKQASFSTSQSSRSHASHTRGSPHDRCDDGIDTSHLPCTRRNSTAIWANLASVNDGNHSGELDSRR